MGGKGRIRIGGIEPQHGGNAAFGRQLQFDREQPFPLTAVDGKDAVRGYGGHGFLEIAVLLVHTGLYSGGPMCSDRSIFLRPRAHQPPDARIIGDCLRRNITSALQSRFRIANLSFIDKRSNCLIKRTERLFKNQPGQGSQPFFTGDGGAGTPLGPERQINILDLLQALCPGKGQLYFRSKFILRRNQLPHLPAALLQVPQVTQPVLEAPQQILVKLACNFFAVAGNKGNGVPFVKQGRRAADLPLLDAQFSSQPSSNHFMNALSQSIFSLQQWLYLQFNMPGPENQRFFGLRRLIPERKPRKLASDRRATSFNRNIRRSNQAQSWKPPCRAARRQREWRCTEMIRGRAKPVQEISTEEGQLPAPGELSFRS